MDLEAKEILYKELSYQVTGLAMEVYNELGYGFLEKVYENALMVCFREAGIKAEQQKPIPVYFREYVVGEYFADILIEGKMILELKTVEFMNTLFQAQMLHYLKATRLHLGLLINFGPKRLEFKRIVK